MSESTLSASAPASTPAPARRGRRRLIAAVVLLVVVFQIWASVRAAGRIRAVIYNDGRGPVAEVVVSCAEERTEIGGMDEESSRYVWFRPSEPSVIVTLAWVAADGRHEAAWAAAPGERLTLRLREAGEVELSRHRAFGRGY